MLVFLFRVGQEGSSGGSGTVASFFGIAKGSINNYVRRTVMALLEMKEETVNWPGPEERDTMRKRLAAYGFRHCVGIIDSTLIELAFRPESYHECYFSHKSMYALNVMIICDDKKNYILQCRVAGVNSRQSCIQKFEVILQPWKLLQSSRVPIG